MKMEFSSENFELKYYEKKLHALECLQKKINIELKNSEGIMEKISFEDEGFILCLCYISALANLYYKKKYSDSKKFIAILMEWGGDPIFSAIHPLQFMAYLDETISSRPKKTKKLKDIFHKIKPFLRERINDGKLFVEDDFFRLLKEGNLLDEAELVKIKKVCCYGTYAAIVYKRLRNPAVHNAAVGEVWFSKTKFDNKPIEPINFEKMYEAAKKIFISLKDKYSST